MAAAPGPRQDSPAANSLTLRVIWSPVALREVAALFQYLRDFNPQAAEQVAASLIQAGDSLANFPYRGRLVPNTSLREMVTIYPYIIRYRISGDEVRILRVRHTAREPTNP